MTSSNNIVIAYEDRAGQSRVKNKLELIMWLRDYVLAYKIKWRLVYYIRIAIRFTASFMQCKIWNEVIGRGFHSSIREIIITSNDLYLYRQVVELFFNILHLASR